MHSQRQLTINRRYLILGGLLAGFSNGLLGAGGGIIIVWILEKAIQNTAHDHKDVFANALAIMLPISLISTISYAVSGSLPKGNISRFLLPAVLGGLLGAFLLDKISTKALQTLFCFLVILSGIVMVIGR